MRKKGSRRYIVILKRSDVQTAINLRQLHMHIENFLKEESSMKNKMQEIWNDPKRRNRVIGIAVLAIFVIALMLSLTMCHNGADDDNIDKDEYGFLNPSDINPSDLPEDPNDTNFNDEHFGKDPETDEEFVMELRGDQIVYVLENDTFIDPGVMILDDEGNEHEDLEKKVEVTGSVDTKVPGRYVLKYEFGGASKTRVVYVVKKDNVQQGENGRYRRYNRYDGHAVLYCNYCCIWIFFPVSSK